MVKMIEDYKKWLGYQSEEHIQNELNFILNLSSLITDVWTAAAYKAMLNNIANHLETAKNTNTDQRENTIDLLREKAKTIQLQARY
jgi:hypothetical protein